MSPKPKYAVVVEEGYPQCEPRSPWRVVPKHSTLLTALEGIEAGTLVILMATSLAGRIKTEELIIEALGIKVVRVSDPQTLIAVDQTLERWSNEPA